MPINYDAINKDHLADPLKYAKKLGDHVARQYPDPTHFLFELLQNAEDSLGKRKEKRRPRKVEFLLTPGNLRFSHFGKLFDESEIRAISDFDESTKREDSTAIGHFGIGFKSVYQITDSPEIHSGEANFSIPQLSYVEVVPIPSIPTAPGETVFVLPFCPTKPITGDEIAAALQKLDARVLLFLKEIQEICWSLEGERQGSYFREDKRTCLQIENARRSKLISQDHEGETRTEEWVIFSRNVEHMGKEGRVEIAFWLSKEEKNGKKIEAVKKVTQLPLVVFFPTNVQTHVGFLIQGPYNSTPARDNVLINDSLNIYLVQETAQLLVESLQGLREMGLLTAEALQTLPLDRQYSDASRNGFFAPLAEAVKKALSTEPLLPTFGGGHVSGQHARLGDLALRGLFNSSQLMVLLEAGEEVHWLCEEISKTRTSSLWYYLQEELHVPEVNPGDIIDKLSKVFLEEQSDEWIIKLYEYLSTQKSLLAAIKKKPIIRVEDGTHMPPFSGDVPQVFLPSNHPNDFPTVKRSIFDHPKAKEFLQILGLTEPDLVDDVIRNVLSKFANGYSGEEKDYADDIERILNAFDNCSQEQHTKLIKNLKETKFVVTRVHGKEERFCRSPKNVYAVTQDLKELFSGVPGVFLVEDSFECLRGEKITKLLLDCGVSEVLRIILEKPPLSMFSKEELAEMRKEARCKQKKPTKDSESLLDFKSPDLDQLLAQFPTLTPGKSTCKAGLLWNALSQLVKKENDSFFYGKYKWINVGHPCESSFDSTIKKQLNETPWIPDKDGNLKTPNSIVFEEIATHWKPNPSLLEHIHFKPSTFCEIEKKEGLPPGFLEWAKKNPDTVAKLMADSASTEGGTPTSPSISEGSVESPNASEEKQRSQNYRDREFRSYVGVHRGDPREIDGPSHEERQKVEVFAVNFVRKQEPNLLDMNDENPNNPGFDLYELDEDNNQIVKWVEVKGTRGVIGNPPVGLTKREFEEAQKRGDAYWLYIVENVLFADSRLVKIRNPAGNAQTFTFDSGWKDFAGDGF